MAVHAGDLRCFRKRMGEQTGGVYWAMGFWNDPQWRTGAKGRKGSGGSLTVPKGAARRGASCGAKKSVLFRDPIPFWDGWISSRHPTGEVRGGGTRQPELPER